MVQRRSSAVSTVSCTLGSSNWRWHTVEGSVSAQDVTVCGRVKRTIRAVRVKLQDGGAVEGDTLPSVVVDR
jgi:cytoskeletal protein CcmA (bactofilin family)